MNETQRRQKLAEALSPENMQALCVSAEKARLKLLSRVHGGTELEVLYLAQDIERLLLLLEEFDDSRTEN